MTFRFSGGKVVEVSDHDAPHVGTQFYVTGDAWGRVVFHVAWKEGRGQRQVNVRVDAETILALADAIRCCDDHIKEDYKTGQRGVGSYRNIGHALWHLENPEMVRPCLAHGAEIIDVDRALAAGPEDE